MAREMLINVVEGEECRVAVIEDALLEELYIERSNSISYVGNIYKGRVINVEPSIQAAFIDFGTEKNGFLHISDLHPKYFPSGKVVESEHIGRRQALRERPPIQQCLKKGQEIVVQVTKEGIKTKGPTLSTYISLPGKYLVMMPWMNRVGVSQKIEDEEERNRLHEMIHQLELPKDCGLIIRTAGQGSSKKDLQNDLSYLVRLWKAIKKRIGTEAAPIEIYRESDLVIRTLRDVFSSKISRIICDSESVHRRISDFLGIAMPRFKNRAIYYEGKTPLFHKYNIEQEISKIQSRRVELKSGGSIVIEQTEALVAIDVNSGRYRQHENAEKTAFKINLEAANEISRQLRLRDLGGLIICDFIDMRYEKNRREVEKVFRTAVKEDRARIKILRMSQFGVIEMTRQRMRQSLQSSTYFECPHCNGAGVLKSYESVAIELVRLLNLTAAKKDIKRIELTVVPDVASYMQNEKRAVIAQLEHDSEKKIIIKADPAYLGERNDLVCFNERGSVVKF